MKLLPSSFSATWLASDLRSRLRASSCARCPSNFFLLASLARSALPCGKRKLRAKPSLTLTVSPIWPRRETRSRRITCMVLFLRLGTDGGIGAELNGTGQEALSALAPVSLSCLSRQLEAFHLNSGFQ